MTPKVYTFPHRILAIVALALSLCAGTSFGQVGNATVVGRVLDSGGAVIIGAQIEMRRLSTNQVFRTVTTGSGDYSLVNIPIDTYELRASSAGFKTEVQTGVKLQVGSTPRIDFRLQVGAITESVEVVAVAPILKTETPEFGQVIDQSKIIGLPLNSRDILGTLGSMTPGLAPARGTPGGSGANFNVRGQRAADNVVLMDGSFVSQGNAAITFFANPDSIQEFEIKTGLYGAEYGVKPGGQFIMITKSGTNQPHGTLFEQLRNNALDARNFFDRGKRPPFKRNQFGGVFGAPIYIPKVFNGKDRAWFFFSYSGERIRQFTSATGVVPTAAQKTGLFATAITDPLTRLPFPGNQIPTSRIDPIAQKLLGFWPDPNTPGNLNFTSPNSSAPTNNDQFIAKVDFKVTDNDRWSARFLKDNSPITRTNAIQAFFRVDPLSSYSQSVTNTRTFKSRIVNEFSAGWFRRPYYAGFQSSSPGYGKTLGIANFPISPTDVNGVPVISVVGLLGLGDGNNSGPSITGNWEVRDNVSFNSGAHS
ncbi:MAG: carboxypeptidase regulatory-like domain-containing protein, partial [Bryobacteraceae bacterium]